MKNQKEDDSDSQHHARELETTGEIMQRAELRKKFLRAIVKSLPAQFTQLKYARVQPALSASYQAS